MRVGGYLAADFDEFVAEEALEEGEEFVDRGVAPEHRRLIQFRVESLGIGNYIERYSSQFKNNCIAETWSASEEGSYLRPVDWCITELWA